MLFKQQFIRSFLLKMMNFLCLKKFYIPPLKMHIFYHEMYINADTFSIHFFFIHDVFHAYLNYRFYYVGISLIFFKFCFSYTSESYETERDIVKIFF